MLLAISVLAPTNYLFAEDQAEAGPLEFNIPSQAVPAALSELAKQAKAQLFFISDGYEHIRTNAVIGTYSTQRALDILLEGTGLVASYSAELGIKVRLAPPNPGVSTLRPGLFAAPQAAATERAASRAQNAEQEDERDPESSTIPVEEILVTGSRIRGAQTAAPLLTITHEDIERGGFATVEQMMQSIPQNFGGGAGQQNNANSPQLGNLDVGAFSGSEVSIDLRGLGTDSTLVLLNSRRMSNGGFDGGFVDISSIPVTAIERVEILTDGASAIYGADAIAGVVNFIVRDDYDGAETKLRYAPDLGSDFSEVRLGQTFGRSWNAGNFLFSYEFYKQGDLPKSERAATASNDLRPLGGDDWRRPGGNPGNISAGGTTYAIPAGQDGLSLTPDDFTAGTQNLQNLLEGLDLLGRQERHAAFVVVRQRLSERVEFFLEPRYSRREATTRTFQSLVDLDVPDSNPFFIDPTGTGLSTVRIEGYSFNDDIGPRITEGVVESFGGATGVSLDLGADWQGEIFGNFAREKSSTSASNILNAAAARDAAAATTIDTALNPFADGSNTSQLVLNSLRVSGAGSTAEQDLSSFHLDFEGPVFDLNDETVDLATGIEFREEAIKNFRTDVAPLTILPGVHSDRRIFAAYAELFFPIVSAESGPRGLYRLEASIAGRYEDYDDFGQSTNPKFGLLWAPSKSLILRGTIGTSFKPPLLTQLDTTPSLENFDAYLGFTPVPAIFRAGGSAELTAEEATTWTAGLHLAPERISDFALDFTYFDIDFKNRIAVASPGLFEVFEPQYAPLVHLNPTQEEITAIATGPRYMDFVGVSAQDLIDGAVPVGAIVDIGLKNVSRSAVRGLDLHITYDLDSKFGRFDFSFDGNYLLEVDQQLLPSLPIVDRRNTVGNPVNLRLRSGVSWVQDGWAASAFLNYTDSYTNDQVDPEETVDSWTTVDARLSYDIDRRSAIDWLSGIRLSAAIQNVFDADPPFVNSNRGIGYDPLNASAIGRTIALEIRKAWAW